MANFEFSYASGPSLLNRAVLRYRSSDHDKFTCLAFWSSIHLISELETRCSTHKGQNSLSYLLYSYFGCQHEAVSYASLVLN